MNVDVLLKDVRFFWIIETELAKKLAKTGSQEYRFIEGCQNGLPGKLMVPKKLVTTEVTTTTRLAESLASKVEVSKQVSKESMVSGKVSAESRVSVHRRVVRRPVRMETEAMTANRSQHFWCGSQ